MPYPGPNPLPIGPTGGGIAAENFNQGEREYAFYAETPGNGGTSGANAYRPTNPSAPEHDVDIYSVSSSPPNWFIRAHPANGFEYAKYTLAIQASGWYAISGAVRCEPSSGGTCGARLVTLVDDVQHGLSEGINQDWRDVTFVPRVHLQAGVHVITVEFFGGTTDLDAVYLLPVHGPGWPLPRIVSSSTTAGEVVVADAVVTDFGAVAGDGLDDRAAFQAALDTVSAMRGGTVFAPAGLYHFAANLVVPTNVCLRGVWCDPASADPQTILAPLFGTDDENAASFIYLLSQASLRDLAVWYPTQGFKDPVQFPSDPQRVRAYPWTIDARHGVVVNVRNITLYNSYKGVHYPSGSANGLMEVQATCLKQFAWDDQNLEYAFFTNIHVAPRIWIEAPPTITNRPVSKAEIAALRAYTSANLDGLVFGDNDSPTIYGVAITEAKRGIVLRPGDTGPHPTGDGTYGCFGRANASFEVQPDGVNPITGSFMNVDRVPEARPFQYAFAAPCRPASLTRFENVRLPPYNAVGDGVADDGPAIQAALNAAATTGGTVYLPPGGYRASALTVPAGVELRGGYALPHNADYADLCVLLYGASAGGDANTPFISIQHDAGVRGVKIAYPDQGFRANPTAPHPVIAYPFTLRVLGPRAWIIDVLLENSSHGIDLSTAACDDFTVEGLWASALDVGIQIGGGTARGVIERSIVSWGPLSAQRRRSSPHSYGLADLRAYLQTHTQGYVLGDCTGVRSLGAMTFDVQRHLWAPPGGLGPRAARLFACSSDSATVSSFDLESGDDLVFVGAHAGSQLPYLAHARPTFSGSARFIDTLVWSGPKSILRQGGSAYAFVEDPEFQSQSLLIGKPEYSSGSTSLRGANRAVDGMTTTQHSMWVSDSSTPTPWLAVDLGEEHWLTRWCVRHASAVGATTLQNTRDFRLEISPDGVVWTSVPQQSVTGNTSAVTDRNLGRISTRWVRLLVTAADQGGGNVARIAEFEVYGSPARVSALRPCARGPYYGIPLDVATASSSDAAFPPLGAFDGAVTTGSKWMANVDGPAWLQFDLVDTYRLSSCVVKHAGAGGEPAALNTRAFKVQVSGNGVAWTTVDDRHDNIQNVTTAAIDASARFVRVEITEPVQFGAGRARIYELELQGKPESVNQAQGRPVSADEHSFEPPTRAVDGDGTTKWTSFGASPNSITVDLGTATRVARWVVKHVGCDGSPDIQDTRNCVLQASVDGTTWLSVDTLANNTLRLTDRILPLASAGARYWRLQVTQGEQTPSSHTRIVELRLYGD